MCFSLLLNMILILSTAKRTSELNFCSRFKINVFYVSKLLELLLLAIRKIIFPQSRKSSLIKEFFYSQGNFPPSRKLSTIKEFFHSQGNFPQSRDFSTIKEFFHSRWNFSLFKKISANKNQKGSLKANNW